VICITVAMKKKVAIFSLIVMFSQCRLKLPNIVRTCGVLFLQGGSAKLLILHTG
jgi:hypothetical protein